MSILLHASYMALTPGAQMLIIMLRIQWAKSLSRRCQIFDSNPLVQKDIPKMYGIGEHSRVRSASSDTLIAVHRKAVFASIISIRHCM